MNGFRPMARLAPLFFALSIFAPVGYAEDAAKRTTEWRDDLEFFARGLRATGYTIDLQRGISSRGQIDFDKLYPKSTFDPALESLEADVATITDAEIVLRLMQLVASANVAHNVVVFPQGMGFDAPLPLGFQWFADGLAVTAAAPEFAEAQGTYVTQFGTMSPDKLLAAVSPYVSHENESWLKQAAPEYIRCQPLLRHVGIIDSDGRVTLRLRKPGKPPFALAVSFADAKIHRVPMGEALQIKPPLSRAQPGKFYWHQYLPESKTLYVQYNVCQNQPGQPFGDFAAQVLADADEHTPGRVVIDLRQNGGGDSSVIQPLLKGLAARIKSIGPMYVLIGPGTFSSAVDNAVELRRTFHAKLVGEQAGGQPISYGEVKLLTLTNSKLVVRYTSKHFDLPNEEKAQTLTPDISSLRNLVDVLAGRDAALEAAIADGRE